MADRVKIEWEPIERDYRSSPFSVREIAKKYNVSEAAIRKQAKKNNLTRDLTEKVRSEVRAKLARTAVGKPEASDEEIIDTASNCGVQVVVAHRDNILRHRKIAHLLAEQLDEFSKAREEIEKTITDETKEDDNTRRRNQMFRAVSLPSHASVLKDLSTSLKNLIPLERQAYGLDNGSEEGDGVTVIIKRQGDRDTDQASPVVSAPGLELP